MIEQAKGALIHNGLSQDLLDMLQTIEESEARSLDSDNSLKSKRLYSKDSMYELRMSILCRNYGKNALWEYAHYVTALQHYFPQGVLNLFWLDESNTGSRLQEHLKRVNTEVASKIESGKLAVELGGERTFTLHLNRVNWVSAWTAVFACIDPAFVSKLTTQNQLTARSVTEFCAYLKQKMDAYIEPRMQTIHAQRQGWSLLSWLETQAEHAHLTDELVLRFWREKAVDDGDDFKRFKTVASVAMTLQEAMRIYEQRQAGQYAMSYSQDTFGEDASWLMDSTADGAAVSANDDWTERSANEWGEPAIDDALYAGLLEEKTELYCVRLAEHPLAEIKFLTAKDAAFFEAYEVHALSSLRLPLSYLRSQIFGDQQSRLTEAQRKKNEQRIDELVALEGIESFNGFRSQLNALKDKAAQTIQAAHYSLLCAGEADALAAVMMALDSDQAVRVREALSGLVQTGVTDISSGHGVSTQLVEVLEREAPKVWKRFENAFSKVNRAGFRDIACQDEVPVYREGIACLEGLITELLRYEEALAKLWPRSEMMNECEIADQEIFKTVYKALYQQNQGYEQKGARA